VPYGLYRASVPVQYSFTSTPPMGRMACTEPQCLYSIAIPLLPLCAVWPLQSLSACTTRVHFTFFTFHIYRNGGCIVWYSTGSLAACHLIKPWKLQRCTSDTVCTSLGTRVISYSINPHRLQTWFPSCCFLQFCMWTVFCLFCVLLEMQVLLLWI